MSDEQGFRGAGTRVWFGIGEVRVLEWDGPLCPLVDVKMLRPLSAFNLVFSALLCPDVFMHTFVECR